jgi:hypothetical protein
MGGWAFVAVDVAVDTADFLRGLWFNDSSFQRTTGRETDMKSEKKMLYGQLVRRLAKNEVVAHG